MKDKMKPHRVLDAPIPAFLRLIIVTTLWVIAMILAAELHH